MGQLRDEIFFGVLDSTGIVIPDDLWSSKDQSKGFDHKATYYVLTTIVVLLPVVDCWLWQRSVLS